MPVVLCFHFLLEFFIIQTRKDDNCRTRTFILCFITRIFHDSRSPERQIPCAFLFIPSFRKHSIGLKSKSNYQIFQGTINVAWYSTCQKFAYETPTITLSPFHFETLPSSSKTVSHTCRAGRKANLLQADARFAFLKSKSVSKFTARPSKLYKIDGDIKN